MKLLIKTSIASLVALIIFCYVPIVKTHQINIKASFFNVANQVNTGNNWKNWYAPIKSAYTTHSKSYTYKEDYTNKEFTIHTLSKTYKVKKHSPAWLEIESGNTFKTSRVIRFMFDREGNVNFTETVNSSLLKLMLDYFSPEKEDNSIINSLKPFMENPSLYYGFEIKQTSVPDTAYIISTITVAKKDKFKMLDSVYNNLRQFAQKHKAKVVGAPYLSYNITHTDSITITPMLVINKNLTYNYGGSIKFFPMPKNGNMLVAHYHGIYGKSSMVYTALERYVTDNNFRGVYVPFERFLSKVPISNQDVVDMEVFYPIY